MVLAFLHFRAGVRWVVALLASTVCVFLIIWLNRIDASYLKFSRSTFKSLQNTAFADDTGYARMGAEQSGTGVNDNGRPAWISPPYMFNTSQVSGYKAPEVTLKGASALPKRLSEAMMQFLERPVLSHEQALTQNEEACPRQQLTMQVNIDQFNSEHQNWIAVDESKIMEMRLSAFNFLKTSSKKSGQAALIGPGFGPDGKAILQGRRGVVIAAGNHRTVEKAVLCIRELRRLGWKDDIEVWHFEEELEEEKDRNSLKELGVMIHKVSAKKTTGQWKNFELKAEAILRSSFDEILYLDSDNYPLSDVTALFAAPLFTDHRGGQAIFWPDLNRDHPDNAIHRVLGIPCHDAWEIDSGQILIAKSGNQGLNLAALYLAHFMQTEGGFWFSGGDKDTFRYAFLLLGIPYTPAPRWLAVLGDYFTTANQKLFCGTAMLQYGISPPKPDNRESSDPSHPEPLFVHANLLKHQSGLTKSEAFPLMRRLALVQDDVQRPHGGKKRRPLDSVAGGGKDYPGRGLCSDIWSVADGAELETVSVQDTFGGLMRGFSERYFGDGGQTGSWR